MAKSKKIAKISLKDIKKIKWQYLVNRRQTLLFNSLTINSALRFKELTGLPWTATRSMHFDSGDLFYDTVELDNLANIFRSGGAPLFIRFAKLMVQHVSALDKLAYRIVSIHCDMLSQIKLCKLVDQYIEKSLNAHNFLSTVEEADKVLSTIISERLPLASSAQRQEWLSILTFPLKENEHTKEERAFYQIIDAYQHSGKNIHKSIKNQVTCFGWIGARGYWWQNAWTEQDLHERLSVITSQNKNIRDELHYLNTLRRKQVIAKKKLIKKLQLAPATQKLIALASEYAYLRTWRTDVIYRAGYRARELFYETMRRAGASEEDVSYLAFNEVQAAAYIKKLPFSQHELRQRKIFYASIFINSNFYIVSGKDWKKRLNFLQPKIKKIAKVVVGTTVYPGWARGRVAVVRQSSDIVKVKPGDILVAVMTFPDLVSAMEKAAAFVTDEGGILCHAAIVAREMRKPCIIATKNATKIFKDGDLVEVDAVKGIVRKIKK